MGVSWVVFEADESLDLFPIERQISNFNMGAHVRAYATRPDIQLRPVLIGLHVTKTSIHENA